MEYASKGNLRSYLSKTPLSFKDKLQIASSIVEGLSFLFSVNIAHRNMKSSNILVALFMFTHWNR